MIDLRHRRRDPTHNKYCRYYKGQIKCDVPENQFEQKKSNILAAEVGGDVQIKLKNLDINCDGGKFYRGFKWHKPPKQCRPARTQCNGWGPYRKCRKIPERCWQPRSYKTNVVETRYTSQCGGNIDSGGLEVKALIGAESVVPCKRMTLQEAKDKAAAHNIRFRGAGNYGTKGLYYYPSGRYKGAWFGTGGRCEDQKLLVGGSKSRLPD